MNTWFAILTVLFIAISASMVLIILVQRPAGGGLAGAFGGAGGSSTDTVFGGRVGDALTVMTVIAFAVYLGLAVTLNLIDPNEAPPGVTPTASVTTAPDAGTPAPVPPPVDPGQ